MRATTPRAQRLLTEREAAERLNVSRQTLLRWRRTRGLPHILSGRMVRYPEAQLELWIQSQLVVQG